MSYKRISPISIVQGGTNDSTLSAYSVVCGGTTSTGSLQSVSGVGSSTQLLTSNGPSALPTWQNAPAAGNITGPGSSTTRAIATWNSTGGTALFNNSSITINSSGQMTNTSQPAFSAYLSASTANNKIGNGSTFYTVLFDTKIFDQGTNYNTGTGVFTAPVTGKYMFIVQCTAQGNINSSMHFIQGQIVTSGRTLYLKSGTFKTNAPSGYITTNASVVTSMTANDVAHFQVYGVYAGNSQSMGIVGGGSPYLTYLSGFLLC